MIAFRAVLQKQEDMDSAYIEIPFDVEKEFGGKRVKVAATFDGVPYRGLIVTMQGRTFIGVNKEIRQKMGKNPGDEIAVTLEKDKAERVAAMPPDLEKRLSPEAKAFYDSLSYTNKKSFTQWIESAKAQATRERRVAEAAAMMAQRKIRK